MKVTDEMVDRACDELSSEDVYRDQVRAALEAALADVPEPEAIVAACDMACKGLEDRIAELEAKLEKVFAEVQRREALAPGRYESLLAILDGKEQP